MSISTTKNIKICALTEPLETTPKDRLGQPLGQNVPNPAQILPIAMDPEDPEIYPQTPPQPDVFPQKSPEIIPQRTQPEIYPGQYPSPEVFPEKSPEIPPERSPHILPPGVPGED